MNKIALLLSIILLLTLTALATTGHSAGLQNMLKTGNDQEKQYDLLHIPWKFTERTCDDIKPVIEALSDRSSSVRETAAFFLGQQGEQSKAICRNTIAPPLLKALKDSDPYVREAAARAVASYNVNAVGPAGELLKDKDPWVRLSAAYALGKSETRDAVEILLNALEDDSDWRYKFVQQECIIALLRTKINFSPEYYKFFKGKLPAEQVKLLKEKGPQPGLGLDVEMIRDIIAAELNEEIKNKIIAVFIKKASDPYLRRMLIEAFGVYGIREAREVVKKATEDSDEIIKKTAVEALGRLDRNPSDNMSVPIYARGPKPSDSNTRESMRVYQTSLNDPSPAVRAAAAAGIGNLNDPSGLGLLATAIKDISPEVRAQAARSLGQISDRKAVDILSESIHDKEIKVKKAIVESLGRFSDDQRAADQLLRALDDNDKQIKKTAIKSLGAFRDDKILRALAPYLLNVNLLQEAVQSFKNVADKSKKGTVYIYRKDGIRHVVTSPTGYSTEQGDEGARMIHPVAVGILLDNFTTTENDIPLDTFFLLKEFEDARIEKLLIHYLRHPSRRMRTNSLWIISNTCSQGVVPYLIDAAQKNEFGLRSFIIKELSRFQDDRALNTIIAGLHDDDKQVRFESMRALARYSKPGAKEKITDETNQTLIDFLGSSDTSLVRASAEAIGVVGRENAIDPLLEVLKKYSLAADLYSGEKNAIEKAAVKALVAFGDRRIIPVFIQVFKNLNSDAKFICIRAFGSFKDNRAVPVLLEYIHGYRAGKHACSTPEAIMALGDIGDETAHAALVGLLNDNYCKSDASKAIGRMKGVGR